MRIADFFSDLLHFYQYSFHLQNCESRLCDPKNVNLGKRRVPDSNLYGKTEESARVPCQRNRLINDGKCWKSKVCEKILLLTQPLEHRPSKGNFIYRTNNGKLPEFTIVSSVNKKLPLLQRAVISRVQCSQVSKVFFPFATDSPAFPIINQLISLAWNLALFLLPRIYPCIIGCLSEHFLLFQRSTFQVQGSRF